MSYKLFLSLNFNVILILNLTIKFYKLFTLVFQSLSKLLGLSEAEVEHVISQIDRCQHISGTRKQPAVRVRFGGDSETHVSVFLECFICNLHVSEQDSQAGVCAISLVKELSDDKKLQLGK